MVDYESQMIQIQYTYHHYTLIGITLQEVYWIAGISHILRFDFFCLPLGLG